MSMEFEELLELSMNHKKRHTKGILATKEKEKREYREVLKQGAGRRNYIKQKKIEMGYSPWDLSSPIPESEINYVEPKKEFNVNEDLGF